MSHVSSLRSSSTSEGGWHQTHTNIRSSANRRLDHPRMAGGESARLIQFLQLGSRLLRVASRELLLSCMSCWPALLSTYTYCPHACACIHAIVCIYLSSLLASRDSPTLGKDRTSLNLHGGRARDLSRHHTGDSVLRPHQLPRAVLQI